MINITRIFDCTEKEIKELFKQRKITITVMGVGYVGIHTAALFANAGAKVFGVDINKELIDSINKLEIPFIEPNLETMINKALREKRFLATMNAEDAIIKSDIIIICVPTPLDENKQPDTSFIISTATTVGKYLQRGSMVILESSATPLTTEILITKILESNSGLKEGEDFGLAHCPERGNPGEMIDTCMNYCRIIGGINNKSTDVCSGVYRSAINGDIIKVSAPRVSEFVKLMENIYIDVNIAFVNEMAILCDKIGIDIFEVLKAARTKAGCLPNTTIDLYEPGVGVGGGCVPVNPYFLRELAQNKGVSLELIESARKINDTMPIYAANKIIDFLKENKSNIKNSKIVILGLTYKADVKDLRNTPAIPLINELHKCRCKIIGFDPFLDEHEISKFGITSSKNVDEAITNADCVVLITAHNEFKQLDLKMLKKKCNEKTLFLDGRGFFDPEIVSRAGFIYKGIGRG